MNTEQFDTLCENVIRVRIEAYAKGVSIFGITPEEWPLVMFLNHLVSLVDHLNKERLR